MTTSFIRAASGRDSLDFFLEHDRRSYYLFSVKFDYWLFDQFKGGVQLRHIFTGSRNPALNHLKDRLIKSVRFAECEHRISVLGQTSGSKKRRARAAYYPQEDIA